MDIDVPPDLVESIVNGHGVVFVGSGISQGAGFPGWRNLLFQMLEWATSHGVALSDYEELEKYIKENELIPVADELKEQFGNERFQKFITETFRKTKCSPTNTHELIFDVPFKAILTSNYDNLLETAFTLKYKYTPHCFTYKEYAELAEVLHGDEFYILKVHGTVDRIETIVLGKNDFREIIATPSYRESLKTIFNSNTVLFLGYGLNDPDLFLFLDELRVAFRDYGNIHYALMDETKINPIKSRQMFKHYGIKIIPYTPSSQEHKEVTHFLTKLANEVKTAQDNSEKKN